MIIELMIQYYRKLSYRLVQSLGSADSHSIEPVLCNLEALVVLLLWRTYGRRSASDIAPFGTSGKARKNASLNYDDPLSSPNVFVASGEEGMTSFEALVGRRRRVVQLP